MTLKIKLPQGPRPPQHAWRPRALLELTGHLLSPTAVVALAFGLWAIGGELKLAGEFAIEEGIFAHWQAWFLTGAAAQAAGYLLQNYFHSMDSVTPYATPNSQRASSRITSR